MLWHIDDKGTHRSATCLHLLSHFGGRHGLPVFLLGLRVLAGLHVLLLQQPGRVELSVLINQLEETGKVIKSLHVAVVPVLLVHSPIRLRFCFAFIRVAFSHFLLFDVFPGLLLRYWFWF